MLLACRLCKDSFGHSGQVDMVFDGIQALQYLETRPLPDLVLLDAPGSPFLSASFLDLLADSLGTGDDASHDGSAGAATEPHLKAQVFLAYASLGALLCPRRAIRRSFSPEELPVIIISAKCVKVWTQKVQQGRWRNHVHSSWEGQHGLLPGNGCQRLRHAAWQS